MNHPAAVASLLVLLGVAVGLVPSASTHTGHGIELAVQPDGCSADTTRCFALRSVPVDARAGDQVEINLHNPGNAGTNHTVYVTEAGKGDPENGTPTSAAIGHVGPIAPGSNGTSTFTVPESETVYLWCVLGDHEVQGMHKTVPLSVEAATGDDSSPSAAPGWSFAASLLVSVGVAVGVARR